MKWKQQSARSALLASGSELDALKIGQLLPQVRGMHKEHGPPFRWHYERCADFSSRGGSDCYRMRTQRKAAASRQDFAGA